MQAGNWQAPADEELEVDVEDDDPDDEVSEPSDDEEFDRFYSERLELLRDAEEQLRDYTNIAYLPSASLSYIPLSKRLLAEQTTENFPAVPSKPLANSFIQDWTGISAPQETVGNYTQRSSSEVKSKRTAKDLFNDTDIVNVSDGEESNKRLKCNSKEDTDLSMIKETAP